MINKIYEKVINYIKENYGYLIVLALIIFLGFYHLPYNLYVGGGTINLKNRLEVENEYSEKGSFNLSYVTSYHATIPSYLLSYVFGWERENINDTKLDENDSIEDIWEREKLYLQEANDNAILSAYDAAQMNYQIKKEVLKILYVDKDSETDLKIGDTILMVDNVEIKELSDLKNILNKYNANGYDAERNLREVRVDVNNLHVYSEFKYQLVYCENAPDNYMDLIWRNVRLWCGEVVWHYYP